MNDSDLVIWKAYGARGWPTVVMVDPDGMMHATKFGEGVLAWAEPKIDALIKKFDGKLNLEPLKFKLDEEKGSVLLFPSKVAATKDLVVIADTNHNRLIVADPAGKITATIGSGAQGFKDGAFAEAQFHRPHGVLIAGDLVYIADTENHRIRLADLKKGTVTTIAGNGKQGWSRKGGKALETMLNSPWDFALVGETLYIAMAGNHAIWKLERGEVGPFSGNGREVLEDGPHPVASFNQPSGLAVIGDKLYVADSEISGVREVDLDPKGEVRTVIGSGLFKFGDVDGEQGVVLCQHVLAVATFGDKLLITDSYNHKLKVVDPKAKTSKTLLGDGKPGNVDGKSPRFHEPAGLAITDDRIYVADTNNHAIRVVDRKTLEVSSLELK